MANTGVNLPSGFGGITRYSEDYPSYFNLKPTQVVIFILGIIAFRMLLGVFYA
jgi:hypothetical protein